MGLLFGHEPVMLGQCLEGLNIKENGTYVDCTVGGGGHASRIAKRLNGGRLIGIDRDESAVMAACSALKNYMSFCTIAHGNFTDAPEILDKLGVGGVDGFLLDLGVSSFQLDTPERGLSYMRDGPLDMRMDRRSRLTAKDIINNKSNKELERIFRQYGEERYYKRIVDKIDRTRLEGEKIETTFQLVELIRRAVPKELRDPDKHPAKRVFQALRIAVNDELNAVEKALPKLVERLNPGGRIAVISFHSLEDRIVKTAFKTMESPCTCPPDFPECVCGKEPSVKIITKKPITPSKEETEVNPRARSAKLRVAEKLGLEEIS